MSILKWFGLPINMQVISATIRALVLNSVLFMGEIFQLLKGMTSIEYKLDVLALKNLLLAPLFEEFIYRVCLINLCLESTGLNLTKAVVFVPIYFAISHLHHVIMKRREPGF